MPIARHLGEGAGKLGSSQHEPCFYCIARGPAVKLLADLRLCRAGLPRRACRRPGTGAGARGLG
jgi:hypothetical protein